VAIASESESAPRPATYHWAALGDINAFFGLMLDNIGGMILMASLLVAVFEMPHEFVLAKMIPGTAVGVLVGDLIYTVMAFRLARRTGRTSVTAMPLGLDTPSTFGAVFLIIGPAYVGATKRGLPPEEAARHAWYVGVAMILASGVFKLACATVSGLVRKLVPRAGLLGSLTAIALVIISFLPLLDIAAQPVAGFVALAIVLVTLTARWELPGNFPGALAGLIVGCVVYYGMHLAGLGPGLGAEGGSPPGGLRVVLPMPVGDWLAWFEVHWRETVAYLPVAIPLALATVVGGIDCTESAAAAGDDYPTGLIIAAEGVSTVCGGLFGGVIQSTPYIGHPAYKAMGARAGYTLATALFVGGAGVLGYFDWIFHIIPKPVVFPILIFVGLEITAQSFLATARRHYPAVALSCVPALAYLALIAVNQVLPETGKPFAQLSPTVQHWLQTDLMLANGFIVTSLLWGTTLAHLIDGRIRAGAAALALAAVFAWFGVIHSPLPDSPIVAPEAAIARLKADGRLAAASRQTPYHWAAAYAAVTLALLAVGAVGKAPTPEKAEEPIAI
jgi:AGZA family xanthine/uracil permease-like MFS transporter